MKQLHIKNKHLVSNNMVGIQSLYEWLANQQLHGSLSRSRTRFLRMIQSRAMEVNDSRQKMAEQFAEKDKHGKPIRLGADGKEVKDEKDALTYKIKDPAAFSKAVEEYFEQTLVIDNTPDNVIIIADVKRILLDTTEEFSGRMATVYDEWCESFEKMVEKPKP